jgi:hypothetical protein
MNPATCGGCVPLTITRDALQRPRYRRPECQGVAPVADAPGVYGPPHRQTAADSRALGWDAPPLPTRPPALRARRPSPHATARVHAPQTTTRRAR